MMKTSLREWADGKENEERSALKQPEIFQTQRTKILEQQKRSGF